MSKESTITDLTPPSAYPVEVKQKAYDLFLNEAMDLTDVAIQLSISRGVVASWAREGQWIQRKQDIEMELMKSVDNKYRDFLIKNRLPTAERHLKTSKALEELIERAINMKTQAALSNAEPSPMDLERLAKALSAATGVSARAVGIAERVVEQNAGADLGSNKRVPLIVIGVSNAVRAPGSLRDEGPPAIDIKVSEEKSE